MRITRAFPAKVTIADPCFTTVSIECCCYLQQRPDETSRRTHWSRSVGSAGVWPMVWHELSYCFMCSRGKGINVALAPCMNMMRAPAGGRNFESSGAMFCKAVYCPDAHRLTATAAGSDPYLQGEVAYETVMGIQSKGVQATAKHFIANEVRSSLCHCNVVETC